MLKILPTFLTRLVLLVLALQILNVSVYSKDVDTDAKDNTIGEVNQIDSVTEFVAEIILDHKNAFPEDGAHNRRSGSSHQMKHISLKIISFPKRNPTQPSCFSLRPTAILSKEEYRYLFFSEIIPPPPKV